MSTDERRLRLLLWAYPRGYRRRHGTEIVTTLLEMAEAGDGRATTGHMLHLVACGIRQRLRLPRRPLAVVAALLAAVALGGLGTVAGTWLGWQTAASVPSTAEAGALTSAAAGLPWPSVDPWRTAMSGPGVNSLISGTGTYDAARVRTALTAAGWRIGTFTEATEGIVVDVMTPEETTVPMRDLRFTATKDGLAAIALAGTGVPAFVAYCKTYQVMVYDTHAPNQYIADSPSDHIPPALTLVSAIIAVLALAGAAFSARRTEPAPSPLRTSA